MNASASAPSRQLTLALQPLQQSGFDNFVGADNRLLIDQLRLFARRATEPLIYLWGGAGSGKTHLLHACCHLAHESGVRSVYVDLNHHVSGSLDILEGLEQFDLVVLDNLQALTRTAEATSDALKIWQAALYELMYAVRLAEGRLLVSADVSPMGLEIDLPDLRTRLGWGQSWQIQRPSEAELRSYLIQQATQQGMMLEEDAVQWLLSRQARSVPVVQAAIEQLANESLRQKRRPSLSFMRTLWSDRGAREEKTANQ